MNDWLGVFLSILVVFGLIIMVTLIEKTFKLSKETSRKLIHIGVGHWIFFSFAWIEQMWMATIPLILFILLNYVSLKKNLFSAMETQERSSYGTIYYPIALLLLTLFFYNTSKLAIGVGVMALAWGDGMAAVIGSLYGKRKYMIYGQTRSLEGSGAMFLFSWLAMLVFLSVYGQIPLGTALLHSLLLASIATFFEAGSYRDFDNLIVPLGIASIYYFFL